jgi:hypothetical protein
MKRWPAALAAASLVAISAGARAETPTAPAPGAYAAGRILYDDGDYDGAYVKFLAAYEASHDPRRLWDMALAEKSLRHYAAALRLVARYLDEAKGQTGDERRRAVAFATAIEPFTASVEVRVNEPGAEVVLDDERLGVSPLPARAVVDLGVRRLRVTKAGFRPYSAAVPIGGRKSVTLDVALVREAGHLTVVAPADAEVAIDGARAGSGVVDADLTSGGHMVRVTAAGRRAFQTEVALGDHEARTITVVLDPTEPAAPRAPEVRVAVGCGGPDALAPEQGLRVYFDGGTVSEALTGLRRRWDNDRQQEVVDYAAFAIDPGRHDVRVRAPGCKSASTPVVVGGDEAARVVGALEPEASPFARGPAGLADGWGLALAAWGGWTRYVGSSSNGTTTTTIPFGGIAIDAENAARFFVFAVDARYGYARPDEATSPRSAVSISKILGGIRFGPRLPLGAFAVSGGGWFSVYADALSPAGASVYVGPGVSGAWWARLSFAPSCSFSGEALFSRGLLSGSSGQDADLTLSLGVRFRPGAACRAERSVAWGLRADR